MYSRFCVCFMGIWLCFHSFALEAKLPDFLILGAQKSGTSSLYVYMMQHPQIRKNLLKKELHFFDTKFGLGTRYYESLFPQDLKPGEIVGEASPCYLYHPRVPERVKEVCPDAKLIVILRDPVDRAYSHYRQAMRFGKDHLSFAEATQLEEERLAVYADAEKEKTFKTPGHSLVHCYKRRGHYAEQLERWFAHFPREQFLILSFEELTKNTDATLNRIFAFLGVEECHPKRLHNVNPGSYEPMTETTRNQLVEYFRPHNQRLEKLLGRSFDWQR